ncbi:DUF775-domain-containing protein [Jaminaea rosea]|uniref:DUF775-domain-containing protein n=1 Tax=Jaminaea rosea TaxID=1569628 RepID=A0A316UY18_9BASI|nr:DUF775-domain-containing protein [Jaminaea rosea]PWN30200.1 DUF775-domain-containing protein [Jaminaea rosea]
MFFILTPGRLPLTPTSSNATQASPTHLIFTLDRADQLNHVVVSMTGETPFPDGLGATVHLQLPDPSGSGSGSGSSTCGQGWRLLGSLTNEKPSAIFRIKGLDKVGAQQQRGGAGMGNATAGATVGNVASLGISVEPLESVQAQMATLPASGSNGAASTAEPQGQLVRAGQPPAAALDPQFALALAPKIANNIFSFLSSFAPDSAHQTVPLLQKWLEQFERKLKMQGAAFLERQG